MAILTYTGKFVDPMNLDGNLVDIHDIAHSLGMQCRYTGHCSRFYSVAEHSVWVSHMVPHDKALAGLLHDAAEAYLHDMASPIKKNFPTFIDASGAAQGVINRKYGLDDYADKAPEVKAADKAMLHLEMNVLMKGGWDGTAHVPTQNVVTQLRCLLPEQAKQLFLERFTQLTHSAAKTPVAYVPSVWDSVGFPNSGVTAC